jgi:hypothetical protein
MDRRGLPRTPNTQFYGPTRFVGLAPKKLYTANEGFRREFSTNILSYFIDMDRVIEVDLDQQAVTGIVVEQEGVAFSRIFPISTCIQALTHVNFERGELVPDRVAMTLPRVISEAMREASGPRTPGPGCFRTQNIIFLVINSFYQDRCVVYSLYTNS